MQQTKVRRHQQQAPKKELLHRPADRIRKLFIGLFAGIFLVISPFLFYSYMLISTDTTAIKILGLTIEAGAHANMNYYAYYFLTKLVFLLCFVIWFLTCKYWWRWAILVPICMLVFQLCGLVNTSISYIDEFDFWYSVPVVIPVLIIILTASRIMRPYAMAMDLREEIAKEIEKNTNQ